MCGQVGEWMDGWMDGWGAAQPYWSVSKHLRRGARMLVGDGVGVMENAHVDLWRWWWLDCGKGDAGTACCGRHSSRLCKQRARSAREQGMRMHVVLVQGQSPMRLYFSPLPACVAVSCRIETAEGDASCCSRRDTRMSRGQGGPRSFWRGGEEQGALCRQSYGVRHLKLCAFE